MIIRIFKVRIKSKLRSEFENDFNTVSLPHVKNQDGLASYTIGYPVPDSPDDYLLITNWESEELLRKFAGADYNQAVIPDGMRKYVVKCWVDHFEAHSS